jgi:hypothetical protein
VEEDPGEHRKVHESLRGPSKSVPLRIVPVVRLAGVCGRLAAQYSKRPALALRASHFRECPARYSSRLILAST